ncbi:D-alanyl-D-alanine carboxypeptidase [Ktedonosporobacter rubrisoli]|uniref:D-alanyl-D-alanine carboxypeptidase n=1 Tax=Ktedonosporobacter rubrisoli TaxID=2509675 RepID=A0A4P6K2K0_KTERU|nr:serine hydrolase [Ktedonosporobacter rubrisoli]QBD82364.1 D-alanyl-D-alanine carboxypeptidase [Ktedonosporobacter rubrisoli]
MIRRVLAIFLLILAACIVIAVPLLILTPAGNQILSTLHLTEPTPTPALLKPMPTPTPAPILTVKGPLPSVQASAAYLLDMDTQHVLDDDNGEQPLPMASTTKIMTALVAIQTGNLEQLIPVKQDAYNRVHIDGGSSANLRVGDKIPLKELLYGLLLPSGDDAAVAIADELGEGSQETFVQRMNLFAYRLHLFQTHYTNVDGLTLEDNAPHYTTAADLARLAQYAMSIPLFAQIVHTPKYYLPATASHLAYTWLTTNNLLTTYDGMLGIKTGHTYAAGYCLVFAAERNKHHLIGVILNSPSEVQRDHDVAKMLNWGFSLPLLPSSS